MAHSCNNRYTLQGYVQTASHSSLMKVQMKSHFFFQNILSVPQYSCYHRKPLRDPPADCSFTVCFCRRDRNRRGKWGCLFFCKLKIFPSWKAIKSAVEAEHIFKPPVHYRDTHLRNFEPCSGWLSWNLNKKEFVTGLTRAIPKASLILIIISN